jgi:hypothetical protein
MDQNTIPTTELKELFPGIQDNAGIVVPSHIFEQNDYDMPVALIMEQAVIAAICKHLSPSMLLEFGTAEGQGSFTLAANTPSDSRVVTVDLARPTDYTERCLMGGALGTCFVNDPTVSGKIQQVLRDDPEGTPPELEVLAGTFDLIHIDGDHTYRGVEIDTECALQLAKQDTIFLWHDFYNFADHGNQPTLSRGVYPYLNDLQARGGITLRHILGTYLVIGSRNWPATVPGTIAQPGELPFPFGERVVRLWETGRTAAENRP